MLKSVIVAVVLAMPGSLMAEPAEQYAEWPLLKSTFPSTGGGGITIKGYDPVIVGAKCVTTFMAVTSDATPAVYPNYI